MDKIEEACGVDWVSLTREEMDVVERLKGYVTMLPSYRNLSATDVVTDIGVAIVAELRRAKSSATLRPAEEIDHPKHYTQHPSGVECIDIVEHFTFNVGNVIKYAWRAGLKSADPIPDLMKARWYADREIRRLQNAAEAER